MTFFEYFPLWLDKYVFVTFVGAGNEPHKNDNLLFDLWRKPNIPAVDDDLSSSDRCLTQFMSVEC